MALLDQLEFEIPTLRRAVKPFLKWAGGKTSLLPTLAKFVPEHFENYFEPFVGGGALFFALKPERGILSDANGELINCYEAVRDFPHELIEALCQFQISSEEFYRVRAKNPYTLSKIERAARLIFLNKTCFNGLYRVNRSGQFNTPFGNYTNVRLVDEDNLFAASKALKEMELVMASYEDVLDRVGKGDFVYLDPPYVPVSAHSDFKRYTAGQFRDEDQVKLSRLFRELDSRGALLLLSNSFHPTVEKLYRGFRIEIVNAPRFINCKGENRGHIKEVVVTNF